MATPFVQGRLLGKRLDGVLTTRCDCCGERIEVAIDSDTGWRVLTEGARPVVSSPLVNFAKLRDPSIIDAF